MRASAWVAVLLVACEPDPRAPIDVPVELAAIEPGDCDVIPLEVSRGPAAPLYARDVVATCEDTNVCTTEVSDRGEVVVRGVGVGKTSVHVAFVHPTTNERHDARAEISVFRRKGGDMLHPKLTEPSACPR